MNVTLVPILLADDDVDDQLLAREALAESRLPNTMYVVGDGDELLDFLRGRGRYAGMDMPRPGVILLDLNMPRRDGRAVLRELKHDPELRQIPVVMLTTSSDASDVFASYDNGVNSYVTKPATFRGLVDVMQTLGRYWLTTVELPAPAAPQ